MSIISGFSMFFISFCPLWISILFIDAKSIYEMTPNLWTEIISISLLLITAIISFVVLMYELSPHNTNGQQEYRLVSAKEEKTITAEYLLSYILPLSAFDFTVWHEVILFLIFFAVFAFLSIRHNHFSVNVLLELMGYRFYCCEFENEDCISINKIVISKDILSAQVGGLILTHALNNEYVVKLSMR